MPQPSIPEPTCIIVVDPDVPRGGGIDDRLRGPACVVLPHSRRPLHIRGHRQTLSQAHHLGTVPLCPSPELYGDSDSTTRGGPVRVRIGLVRLTMRVHSDIIWSMVDACLVHAHLLFRALAVAKRTNRGQDAERAFRGPMGGMAESGTAQVCSRRALTPMLSSSNMMTIPTTIFRHRIPHPMQTVLHTVKGRQLSELGYTVYSHSAKTSSVATTAARY